MINKGMVSDEMFVYDTLRYRLSYIIRFHYMANSMHDIHRQAAWRSEG